MIRDEVSVCRTAAVARPVPKSALRAAESRDGKGPSFCGQGGFNVRGGIAKTGSSEGAARAPRALHPRGTPGRSAGTMRRSDAVTCGTHAHRGPGTRPNAPALGHCVHRAGGALDHRQRVGTRKTAPFFRRCSAAGACGPPTTARGVRLRTAGRIEAAHPECRRHRPPVVGSTAWHCRGGGGHWDPPRGGGGGQPGLRLRGGGVGLRGGWGCGSRGGWGGV